MGREVSSAQQFLVGDRVKGYEILKVFDPGGFAFAGKARAPSGRTVFFKKYKRPGGSSAWQGAFMEYQAELKRRIQAEPAAKNMCYEFVEFFDLEDPSRAMKTRCGKTIRMRAFYQVFEWIDEGSDLRKLLDDPKGVSWAQKVMFAKMLAQGINCIHKAGVIHTDLKPENFYLIPDASLAAKYKLRVIDMDFSLLDKRTAPWDGHEGYVGTPGYMSPEHIATQVPVRNSDVFTCGLILSELLCGAHPAAGRMDDEEKYAETVKSGRLTPIEVTQPIEKVGDLRFLNHVLNGCLRLEPSRRPTIEEVLRALNGSLDRWDGKTPQGSGGPVPPEPRRDPEPAPRPSPPPPPPPPPRPQTAERVEIVGASGRLVVSITSTLGKAHFASWGDEFPRFMSAEQFRLSKGAVGWTVEHCPAAVNMTNADGVPLSGPVPVRSGMKLSLGKTGKCPIELRLQT